MATHDVVVWNDGRYRLSCAGSHAKVTPPFRWTSWDFNSVKLWVVPWTTHMLDNLKDNFPNQGSPTLQIQYLKMYMQIHYCININPSLWRIHPTDICFSWDGSCTGDCLEHLMLMIQGPRTRILSSLCREQGLTLQLPGVSICHLHISAITWPPDRHRRHLHHV